jgi:hypothetical protein
MSTNTSMSNNAGGSNSGNLQISGGNDNGGNNFDKSTPRTGPSQYAGKTLEELKRNSYSFRKDKVRRLFKNALKDGLELQPSKRPDDIKKSDDPNYCPYHRMLGHAIEDCFVFKDWLERRIRKGEITLSENVRQDTAPHECLNMISHSSEGSLCIVSQEEG